MIEARVDAHPAAYPTTCFSLLARTPPHTPPHTRPQSPHPTFAVLRCVPSTGIVNLNVVLEVFVTSTGSKFHLDRQCQYLRGKKVTSFGLCSCCERKRLLEQRVTTVQSGM